MQKVLDKNDAIQSYSQFPEEDKYEKQTFDSILSKIGFGKILKRNIFLGRYQLSVFIIVGVIGMCDAGESQALSLVLPILQKEWGISDFDESLMGSLVYAGYFMGSLVSGMVADQYGRKKPIFYTSLIMFIVALAGAFMPDFVSYTIFRFQNNIKQFFIQRILLVTCVGFIIPIAFSLLTETTPIKYRGIVLIIIGLFYTLGEYIQKKKKILIFRLTVCLLAYIFMPTLITGDWRAVLAWASVPAGIVFLISLFILQESPRFLLIKGLPQEARQVMIKMAVTNKKYQEDFQNIGIEIYQQISSHLIQQEMEEQGIDNCNNAYYIPVENDQITQQVMNTTTRKLFSKQFRLITSIVWVEWFVSALVFAGITFLLPLTLRDMHKEDNEDENDLNVITLSVLGEFPTIIIASVIVNIKQLGRKNSLAIAYFISGICCLLIYILHTSNWVFSILIAGSKLSINLAFTINYEFTSEVYPTYMRASGIGLASSVGKIGSILMPWIVIYLSRLGTFVPYTIFAGFCFLAFIMTLCLPYDTYQRELDSKQ